MIPPLLAAQKASTSLTITTPIMHIMPIIQIKHTLVGVLRVAQGLSRHPAPPLLEVPWFWWCCPCEGLAGRWKAATLSLHADEMACRHLPPA